MNVMKKLTAGILGMLVLGMAASKVYAYSDNFPTNDTAQITITITPNVDRQVYITTDNVNMNLGAMSLGALVSTQTVLPATVTVVGTIANTDLFLTASIASDGGLWSFDSDSTTVETNSLAAWMTLTATTVNDVPQQDKLGAFGGTDTSLGSDLVTTAPGVRIGSGATPGRYEDASTDCNNIAAGTTKRHLWTYFRMPSDTTTTFAQRVTFILTVGEGL